jgi:hypothetical protein
MDIPVAPVLQLMQRVAKNGEPLPQVARRRIPWLKKRVAQDELLELYRVLESKLIDAQKKQSGADADDLSFDMECVWAALDHRHRVRAGATPHLRLLA